MDYRAKYLKYKAKYLDLKAKLDGGVVTGITNSKCEDTVGFISYCKNGCYWDANRQVRSNGRMITGVCQKIECNHYDNNKKECAASKKYCSWNDNTQTCNYNKKE